jgi:adenylate cyclase
MTSDALWPKHRTDLLDWLVRGTRDERFIDNILVELCQRLRAGGVPVARCILYLDANHPQWLGASLRWRTGMTEAEIIPFDYDVRESDRYFNSPIHELRSGAPRLRSRLDGRGDGTWYPVYDDLRAEGFTDYAGWPIFHTLQKQHTITFASDGPDGFSDADLDLIEDLLPVFAMVTEIRLKNRITRTILETYVGRHASEEVLAGSTRRGSGKTVNAAILVCDLRGFTAISDLWPRDDVIELLNGYFDALALPVEAHGGEILKFMGDGLLAIFPTDHPGACRNLLTAVAEAQANMAALNAANRARWPAPLQFGLGIHVGDVMYGNIGSQTRLDFTVIGPAVNIAARLEALTKTAGRQVLLSGDFVALLGPDARVERLGLFDLKGVQLPLEVFALAEEAPPTQG